MFNNILVVCYNQLVKKYIYLFDRQHIQMKTKTGKLLMQLRSSKSPLLSQDKPNKQPQIKSISTSNCPKQKEQFIQEQTKSKLQNYNSSRRPVLANKGQHSQIKEDDRKMNTDFYKYKNYEIIKQLDSTCLANNDRIQQKFNYQQKLKQLEEQIEKLNHENKILNLEIVKLRENNSQLIRNKNGNLQSGYLNQSSQKCRIKQQNISLQSIKKQQTPLKNISNFTQQYQNIIKKLQQKNRSLQIQNYRLIQQNFILMLNIKKNMKNYKQSIFKISNKLENLQTNEASRYIYQLLSNMKIEQKNAQSLNKELFPQKSKQTKVSHLKFISKTVSIKYMPAQNTLKQSPIRQKYSSYSQTKINDINNEQQRNTKRLKPQNQNFNFIPFQNKYRSFSDKLNNQPNCKLFSSDIRDLQFQNLFGQPSITQKMQSQGENMLTKKFKQYTVHKSNGNNNQLLKMLLLQASVIQQFF